MANTKQVEMSISEMNDQSIVDQSSKMLSEEDNFSKLESGSIKSETELRTVPKQGVSGGATPIPVDDFIFQDEALFEVNPHEEKKEKAIGEIADLNQGDFFQRFGELDTNDHRTHQKIGWFLAAIPETDPRKALVVLYHAQLEKFAQEVLGQHEALGNLSPLEMAEFVRQKAIEHRIPQVAILFSSLFNDLKKDHPQEVKEVEDALLKYSKETNGDNKTVGSDLILVTQLLNRYPAVLESVIKRTGSSATDYHLLTKMHADFVEVNKALDNVPLISLQLFSSQKDVQLTNEQKEIDKLLKDVRVSSHLELSPIPLAKEGVYQAQREQASQKALSALTNYCEKNVKNLAGKSLDAVLANTMTLLENVKQPPPLQDIQKIIKVLEKASQTKNLTEAQTVKIISCLEQCHKYDSALAIVKSDTQKAKPSGFFANLINGIRIFFSTYTDAQKKSQRTPTSGTMGQVLRGLSHGQSGQGVVATVQNNKSEDSKLKQQADMLYKNSLTTDNLKSKKVEPTVQNTNTTVEPMRMRR